MRDKVDRRPAAGTPVRTPSPRSAPPRGNSPGPTLSLTSPSRAVVSVANRLPIQRTDVGWELAPGGLVTALRPVMEAREGVWVGWDGAHRGVPERLPSMRIQLRRVRLNRIAVEESYHGFSNRTLWPLLHNAIERPIFDRAWWSRYREVNQRFGQATVEALNDVPGALLWVHDYHVMLVPRLVRQALPGQRIGFFLHVPWPSPDIYARVPWRDELLRGLLGADVVSFHVEAYRTNFVRACSRLLRSDGVVVRGSDLRLPDGRVVRTTASPISIDAAAVHATAISPETDDVVAEIREQFAGKAVLLGVDRLDYTKGIIERLLAFELLLERRADLRHRIVLIQIAVPSRDDAPEYRDLRDTVERLVGRINGRFTLPGGDVPVHYMFRSIPPAQLFGYFALANVLLVTPLIDGMNLVAKEFVVVQHARGGDGVLLLSEFTGAAQELREAVMCNPFDLEGLAARVEAALTMDRRSRRSALRVMAQRVHRHDVHTWLDQQLGAIEGPARPTPHLSATAR